MPETLIACPTCSKKFKLPERPPATFTCTACQTVMDLSAFATAPPEPARAPSRTSGGASASRARGGGARAAGARRRGGGDDGEGRGAPPKKESSALLWGSIGGIVIVALIAILVLSKSSPPPAPSGGTHAANAAGTDPNAMGGGSESPTSPSGTSTDAPAPGGTSAGVPAPTGATDPGSSAPAGAEPSPAAPSGNASPSGAPPKLTKTYLSKLKFHPMEHHPDATPEERAKIDALVDRAVFQNGGADSRRAEKELVPYGVKAGPRLIDVFARVDAAQEWTKIDGLIKAQIADRVLRDIDGVIERRFGPSWTPIRATSKPEHAMDVARRWLWWWDSGNYKTPNKPWDERTEGRREDAPDPAMGEDAAMDGGTQTPDGR